MDALIKMLEAVGLPGVVGAVVGVVIAVWLRGASQREWRRLREKSAALINQRTSSVPGYKADCKPFLVLANPIGGNGDAISIYNEIVKPTLDGKSLRSLNRPRVCALPQRVVPLIPSLLTER